MPPSINIDTQRLRTAIFERSGIAIDEHDPIMAVLVASAQQTEEIGARLLRRMSPLRIVAAVAITGVVFATAGSLLPGALNSGFSLLNALTGCASKAIHAGKRCCAPVRGWLRWRLLNLVLPNCSQIAVDELHGKSRMVTASRRRRMANPMAFVLPQVASQAKIQIERPACM